MLTLPEYEALVEQSPIMIWRARTDMLCDYFNARWLTFTGRTLEQEWGNGWAESVHADDMERCLAIYVSHFERREIFEMHYRLKRHDGQYRWILDRGVPYFGTTQEFLGYIGSCVDVTEKVEAEMALEESRAKEIAKLQSFLPVCAWCKKVRTDEGYWQELATYISEKVQPITHGICAQCMEKQFACDCIPAPSNAESGVHTSQVRSLLDRVPSVGLRLAEVTSRLEHVHSEQTGTKRQFARSFDRANS